MITIYGLVDPRTDSLRYVGQTTNVSKRYSRHLHPTDRSHRTSWLRGLLTHELKPELVVLEQVETRAEANDAERFWIASLRLAGADLVNRTDGGEGGATRSGMRHTAETRAKISASHIGIGHTPEARAKMSAARRGVKRRPHSPEMAAQIATRMREIWRLRKLTT